jgi:hypothetical protein
MGRFVPITVSVESEKRAPKYAGAKVYYDGKQCWQYKVVYDRPGTYTFNVPAGVSCVRTVIVGGGGKPSCLTNGNCCSFAGAGGAYSERCMTVSPGTALSIQVGRQQQDSAVCCNTTLVHTAGGASGSTPGVATGGDWNSRGGCSGFSCNNCGGSLSHFCGSCKYVNVTNCCGYCIVYQFDDAANGGSTCCNAIFVGGASAGTPDNICGGCSSTLCGYLHSGIAGGGGGIGSQILPTVWHYNCCTCICVYWQGDGMTMSTNWPASAEGGHGSQNLKRSQCRAGAYTCLGGIMSVGSGGSGGPEGDVQNNYQFEWGYEQICAYPYGGGFCMPQARMQVQRNAPCRINWWDISDICGSGSPGFNQEHNFNQCGYQAGGISVPPWPENSGEGAGTGGIITYCCNPHQMGMGFGNTSSSGGPNINWTLICHLGVCGKTEQAWLPGMQNSLFPFFITCAGTLGGSGGVGWCGFTSKAGFGGGGGQAKCQFLCVCWGGNFDRCNNNGANPLLAFPPCLLDQMVSNAGLGLAIIYYREA